MFRRHKSDYKQVEVKMRLNFTSSEQDYAGVMRESDSLQDQEMGLIPLWDLDKTKTFESEKTIRQWVIEMKDEERTA